MIVIIFMKFTINHKFLNFFLLINKILFHITKLLPYNNKKIKQKIVYHILPNNNNNKKIIKHLYTSIHIFTPIKILNDSHPTSPCFTSYTILHNLKS